MSRFYSGAKRIEEWMDRPKVARFMNAAAVWYFVVAAIFIAVCLVAVVVAVVEAIT